MPEHVPNTVLYNRYLEPPNNTTEVPDTHGGRISGQSLIDQDSGWAWAPLPGEPERGQQAEPVEFVPVAPVARPEDLTVEELKDRLRERDLPVSGSKDELVDRLTESTQSKEG